jgi:uncharacterized OB-fold protein
MSSTDVPFRILPRLDDGNRDFWTAGERGELRFWRCLDDGFYIHPYSPLCPRCHSKRLETQPVSGKATVVAFTINYQPWMPGPELPFAAAIVEMPEQAALRLTTNIVNCDPNDVFVGMKVRVTFEHHPDPDGDVYIPVFEPDRD